MSSFASLTRCRPWLPWLVLALAACQQQEPPVSRAPDATREPPATVTAAPEPVPVRVEPEPEPIATLAEPQAQPEPLNLDIPADILDETGTGGYLVEEQRYLPNLFGKKKSPGRKISSELLFEEGEQASLDTVSGAKVTIEVPVN